MATLPLLVPGLSSNLNGIEVPNGDPALEAIATPADASFAQHSNNSGGTFSADFDLPEMPADFASMDTLTVRLRYLRAVGTAVNTWNSLQASVVNSAGAALSNTVTIASNITTTTATNSGVITLTGLNTTADKTVWDNARLRIFWVITRSMGGDTLGRRVTAGELTGTYTTAAPQTTFAATADAVATVSANLNVQGPIGEVVATAAGGASFTYPAGFIANDVGVVVAFRDNSETPPTVPAGWTTIRTKSINGCSAVAAYRTLTGAESGSVTFTGAVSTALTVYRGLDPADPVGNASVSASSGETVYIPDLELEAPQYLPPAAVLVGVNRTTAVPEFDYTGTPLSFSHDNAVAWSATITDSGGTSESNGTILLQLTGSTSTVIRSTTDGITWTNRLTTPASVRWLEHGGGLFVAVLTSTTTYYTSPDGITWTSRTAAWTGTRSLRYANGVWVLITGVTNEVYTSTNGTTWTARNLNGTGTAITNGPTDAAFANGRWLCVTDQGGYSYSDNNGTSWTYVTEWDVTSDVAQTAMRAVHRLGSINGRFICHPREALRVHYYSDDGLIWRVARSVRRSTPSTTQSVTMTLLNPWRVIGDTAYASVSATAKGPTFIYTKDGTNYYYGLASTQEGTTGLSASGNMRFLVLNNRILLGNGANYTLYGHPQAGPPRRITSTVGNSAVASFGRSAPTPQILAGTDVDFSTNWLTYAPSALSGLNVLGVAKAGAWWVAVTPTQVWRSENLVSWQQITVGTGGTTYGRVVANDTQHIISVANSSNLPSFWYSSNATTWTERGAVFSALAEPQYGFVQADSTSAQVRWFQPRGDYLGTSVGAAGTQTLTVAAPNFNPAFPTDTMPFPWGRVGGYSTVIGLVMAGASNQVFVNGRDAVTVSTGGSAVTGAAGVEGSITVCATDGFIYTTEDAEGKIWYRIDPGLGQPLRDMVYAKGTYAVVGDAGAFAVSTDRFNWTVITSPLGAQNLTRVYHTASNWVLCSSSGGIATLRD
jgi:hypothetical protein